MANFSDLNFEVHAGDPNTGWEAIYVFPNFYQIHVVCGPAVFTEDSDATLLSGPNDYATMEYKIFDGVNEVADDQWVGGQSQGSINIEMARVEALEPVYTAPLGE